MKHTSIMWQYIQEENVCLPLLLSDQTIVEVAKQLAAKQLRTIYFVASGSSLNVAQVCSMWMERYWGVSVQCMTPFTFLHQRPALRTHKQDAMVFATSQTGTSRGTLECVRYAKELGYEVLTLTEREDTPIAQEGTYYLNFRCGEEDSNAKTKGYSANLVLLMRLIAEVAKCLGTMPESAYHAWMDELEQAIKALADVQQRTEAWVKAHPTYANIHDLYCIGYGVNLATASEAALKLMETMSIPSAYIDIEEFSHGMHRAIHKDSTIFLFCSDAIGKEDIRKTYQYFRGICDHVLLLDAGQGAIEADDVLTIPYLPLSESALLLVGAVQVVSVAFPEWLNRDPNYPYHQAYTEYMQTRVG